MIIEEELNYVAEKVLGHVGKIPTKMYKESYEAIHGAGSCALTCEFPVNTLLTIRLALDYKSSTQLLGSNISVIGSQPLVLNMILEGEEHEEQIKNFSTLVTIELYNFLSKIAKMQQADVNKTRGIMTRLKKGLNEV
jgi:hypothetical protein